MVTRITLPRSMKDSKIVLLSAYKEEEQKLGGSSEWGRSHLKMLGVKNYTKTTLDLDCLLGVKEPDWPPELQARTFLSLSF
jgi:hypothetical protein